MLNATKLYEITSKAILDDYTSKREDAEALIIEAEKIASGGEFEMNILYTLSEDIKNILRNEGYCVTTSDGTTIGTITKISWANAISRY
jgi:hypothetical protein